MSRVFAAFPGQGSQSVGMAKQALEQFPYTKIVFEKAEDSCKVLLQKLCCDGDLESLTLTSNQQPAILTTSIAFFEILKQETALQPTFFAGHSVGEYSALVASQALDLSDAAHLVRQRGLFMQEAVPVGEGAMAAVLRYPEEQLIAFCKAISTTYEFVTVANYNSKDQLIVSGHTSKVEEAMQKLKAQRVIVKKLPVSAPFHSPLMHKAREQMTPLLQTVQLASQTAPVYSNITGQPQSKYSMESLIQQIDQPVLWTQTINHTAEQEVDIHLEIGPGRVLTGLAKKSLPPSTKLLNCIDMVATIKELNSET